MAPVRTYDLGDTMTATARRIPAALIASVVLGLFAASTAAADTPVHRNVLDNSAAATIRQ